jgi:cellulose synthase (UDP-forming)/cellulose synthase operon protein B
MSGYLPQSGWTARIASVVLGLLAFAAGVVLCPLLILPLPWKEQAIIGAVLIAFAIVLNKVWRSVTVTMLLMGISVFSTLRYGYWRVIQTWEGITSAGHIHQWDTVFVLLLLAAEFFAFSTLILGYFQTLRPLQRPPLPLEGGPEDWPTVDVLIPTYNEPLHVVRGTVVAAKAMDYPAKKMRVMLLDDGRREEFRDFAAQVGVEYVTRGNNAHAKAGNINHALERISGEFVAIFDSDHVPDRSFLQMTLGWFQRDNCLGLVQTPHHFYSPDPFERNLGQFRRVPNEGELFHRLVQDGNDLWNASFFCGSCAVLRRKALDEIGGIAIETVTEDAHTALRMQRLGWNTAYINIPKAAGLATESLAAHIGQRIRWARGMTQILRTENPLFSSGLTLSQRLCYFNATTHFLFAVPRLIFLTVPLVYLFFGRVNIYGYTWAVLAYAAPHLVLSTLTNSRIQGRYRYSFWNEIYEVVLAPYILFPTLLALINPKLGRFNVTSKGGIMRRSYFDRRIALPYLLLLALNVAGIVMGEHRYFADPAHRSTVLMNAAWAMYNAMILSVAVSVAWERRKLRAGTSLRVRVPAALRLHSDQVRESDGEISGAAVRLSRDGAVVKFKIPLELARGSPALLTLGEERASCEIQALVAHSAGRFQHLFFPDLSLEDEEQIAHLAHRRWRTWRSLQTSRPSDQPLSSLLQIFLLALRGIVILPIGLLLPPPAAEPDLLPPARKRRAAFTVLPVLLLAGLVVCPATQAQKIYSSAPGKNAKQPVETQPANFHDRFELGAASGAKTLSLQGSGASLKFFFDEPVTKITTNATLNLNYAAPDLRPNEARLELTLNGADVGSVALVPGSMQHTEFELPTDLLTSDNTLSVELRGNCSSCGSNNAPWVTLDPASTLILDGTRLQLGNDLSLLPLPFFDPAGLRSWSLPVVFGGRPDNTTLESAALVASWFGVLSDVRGVHFPVSIGAFPNGNALVFALRGSSILDGLSLPSESGPLLAMRDNPHDPYGKLLIITGDDSEDLLEAARALTSTTWMPHVDSMRAHAGPITPRKQYDAPRWLLASQPSAIGTYTTTEHLKLQGTGSINVYFRLPPDLFLQARQSIPLLLKYQYSGAPKEVRPALSVRLNGKDVDSVQLKPASSLVEGSETFRLPTGSLHAYTNTLTVDFYFGRNSSRPNLRPTFAVGQSSSLDLSGLPHSVVLPRLELFADAGYPFTEWPDCSRTAVIMPRAPTPIEYETLLDMVGFFGAQTGALTSKLDVTGPNRLDQVRQKDLVLIGIPASQPLLSKWADSMPLDLTGPEMRVNQAPESTLLLHPEWPFREYDRARLQRLLGESAGNAGLFVESFVSPLHPDRVVVAVDPGGPNAIDGVRALFTPSERQGPVYGGVAAFQNGHFESFLVGTLAYHTGDHNRYQFATVLLFEHYRLIPLIVLLLCLVIAAWVRFSTERVAARRLATYAANRG